MSLKVGVILYHSDIEKIYKRSWIEKCLNSIRNQTFQDFVVYELCYSQNRYQWWPNSNYSHIKMPNHIYGMNHILDKAFLDGCDVVMNVNMDDWYSPDRFALQLETIKDGYELISNDFDHMEEINGEDIYVRSMVFSSRDIKKELAINHNILCHSSIAFTKKFWDKNKYYKTTSLGFEDRELWQKAIAKDCKIKIIDKILCYYRLSPQQTGRIHKAI